MTALIIMFGITATVAVIMFGIYMVAKISPDLAIRVRKLEQEKTEQADIIRAQNSKITQLKLDLDTEKNRKVHPADEVP